MGGNNSGRKLHRDERRAIVRARLGGCSIRVTARRLGVDVRTVQKYAPASKLDRLRKRIDGNFEDSDVRP